MTKRYSNYYLPVIILSGIIFFIPFLGNVHLFDWDEINFAESAREMIVTGNYHRVQINFQPFWEKPPLFFWMQVVSMKVFGINEFAARLPNAVIGIITLITFYVLGRKHKNELFGFLWALCYLGSFLPHIYFKSGIIDPVFNYFIFMGVYYMYRVVDKRSDTLRTKDNYNLFIILSGTFIGLANLTKGPVGLLIFLLTFLIYFISRRFKGFPSLKQILIFTGCFGIISFFWFGQEVILHGFTFLREFLTYQANLFLHPIADHGEPFYYHFVVVFFGCFPISILALPVLFGSLKSTPDMRPLLSIQRTLFWVVLILFSLSTTKIIHYSSLTYFPLSFMAAFYVYYLIEERQKLSTGLAWMLAVVGGLLSLAFTALPFVAIHKEWLIPLLKDPFAVASFKVSTYWGGWEFIFGILYFIGVIVSLFMIARKKTFQGFLLIFYGMAFFLLFFLAIVVPKIESYSQAPAINFYKSLEGKDVYVTTFGFKSYAQYFYFKRPAMIKNGEEEELNYLITGPIDKPAYFVTKITNTDLPKVCPSCQVIKQEGGFIFYKRDAVKAH